MNVDGAMINIILGPPADVALKVLDVVSVDGTTIGAILGFLGLVVTTLGGVYVATNTSRSEKASVAQKTLEDAREKIEATRDEATEQRIKFRDERIIVLEQDLANCKLDHKLRESELEDEIDQLQLEIARLRGSHE